MFPNDKSELLKYFQKRTDLHRELVQKYCNKLFEIDPITFKEMPKRGEDHDLSKYKEPELDPYLLISWEYKDKDEGKPCYVSAEQRSQMQKATDHHVHTNSHHPEYYDSSSTINKEDRDKNPDKIVDSTDMTELDIAEMCCDWCAMSEEKGNSPFEWADSRINKRWKFTDDQVDLIYYILELLWK